MRVCEYRREVKTMEPYQVLELEEEDWDAVRFALYCGGQNPALCREARAKAHQVYAALCKLTGVEPCPWQP